MKKYSIWMLGAALLPLAFMSYRAYARQQNTPSSVSVLQTSWGKLGTGTVEPTENGSHTVNANAGDRVHAIKIKVLSGGVNLHRCEIYFYDGSKKSVDLRNDVPAGAESREINLADNNRQVSRIVFWYDTRNYNQKAEVELWGKKLS